MQWYTDNTFYDTLLIVGFLYALLIFVSNLFGTAAYGGRFGGGSRAKGIKLHSKTGWILMELPGLIVFPVVFFMGANSGETVPLFFLAIWMIHYSNRAPHHASPHASSARGKLYLLVQCGGSGLGYPAFTWILQRRVHCQYWHSIHKRLV